MKMSCDLRRTAYFAAERLYGPGLDRYIWGIRSAGANFPSQCGLDAPLPVFDGKAMREPSLISCARRTRGLLRLLEARVEADAAAQDVWQFAVPIDVLRNHSGLTLPDIRWLVARGLAAYGIETTRGGRRRTFRRHAVLSVSGRACFVATDQGLKIARHACSPLNGNSARDAGKPSWDAATGDLTIGGKLVKHLRESATAQRAILDACHAAFWGNPVASPFAAMPVRERSRYLRRLLYELNQHHQERVMHFASTDKAKHTRWVVKPLPQ